MAPNSQRVVTGAGVNPASRPANLDARNGGDPVVVAFFASIRCRGVFRAATLLL